MSNAKSTTGIKSVGGLLPSEFLFRLRDPKGRVSGLREMDYHLAPNERLGEIITRSWNRLVGAWTAFSTSLSALDGSTETASVLTREKWLALLFMELGFGRLPSAKGIEINGRSYPISNEWGSTPIHLVGARVPLDRRSPGVRGAAGMSPHALVQELLNQSEERLWGIVSNGLILRILRDSTSLTRQSYLEFDLQIIFSNERFDDFVTFWMVCHESRFETESGPSWLEKWRGDINVTGIRALDALQKGVRQAITALGCGFLAHPENRSLREALQSNDLSGADFYRELLRLVYRILFLFVAEDRGLIHAPDCPEMAKKRYETWYSTSQLRRQAWGIRSNTHDDLWQMFRIVMSGLGKREGLPQIGLSPLGSFLWSDLAVPTLHNSTLANGFFSEALIHLSTTESENVRRNVDFANLGAEELGSVYESLLELHPILDVDSMHFELENTAGNERKTSGSYYTPTELVTSLLETALDPVLDEAANSASPEAAILALKVFDPTCGSGHFLIAAAHRIAQRLAAIRTGESEAPPEEVRHAIREVISKCCYGVDINPMAVELTKVSLWMEATEPGKPLSYLDRHIVVGNALFGATPNLIEKGIPDDAYKQLEGDSKSTITSTKALNRKTRGGLQSLPFDLHTADTADLATRVIEIEELSEDDLPSVEKKAALWVELQEQNDVEFAKLASDVWCSAFVYEKRPDEVVITSDTVSRALNEGPDGVGNKVLKCVERLAQRYRFLHLHIAFPEVFSPRPNMPINPSTGWSGGFDVVLGNPPWGQLELKEQEFFAVRSPEIASAEGANRKRLIKELSTTDPPLFQEYIAELRIKQGESSFLRGSGRFPLTGRGRINSYAVFAELARDVLGPKGRCGIIVPSGIATDDTTSLFFADLTQHRSLVSLFDFENRLGIFPAVDSRQKFCLLTLTGSARPAELGAKFVFFAHEMADLAVRERQVRLSADDFALFNPNTRTSPIFRKQSELELAKKVYQTVPVLIKEGPPEENPWGAGLRQGLFNMTSASGIFMKAPRLVSNGAKLEGNMFISEDGKKWLPLYEAKLFHHFDHRFATYEGATGKDPIRASSSQKQDPNFAPLSKYWVAETEVKERLKTWDQSWLLGIRSIARSNDERSVIASVLPSLAVGHSITLLFPERAKGTHSGALLACLSSFAFDAIARMKLGGTNLTPFVIKQLPVLAPGTFDENAPWSKNPSDSLANWISKRVLELTYTSPELSEWAKELGYEGRPFPYDDDRRALLRAELDACFFHLYGFSPNQVDETMESFPIVKQHDEAQFGEYRTKKLILQSMSIL